MGMDMSCNPATKIAILVTAGKRVAQHSTSSYLSADRAKEIASADVGVQVADCGLGLILRAKTPKIPLGRIPLLS